jgi:hypothetical protein
MKIIIMLLFLLIPLLCKSQTTQNKNHKNRNLHASINATGGDISSEEGSVSYSIGQVYYTSLQGNKNHVTEGIQQPLVISITPIDKIDEKEEEIFKLAAYPNPVTDYFIIEASTYNNRSLSYHLMDLQGRLLKLDRIGKSGAKVDISRLSAAIYLLRISDNGKHIKTIKIIKK